MEVAIPHALERAEVRRRLKANSHEIADHIPGGMATVATDWPSEDRMAMTISAIGQSIIGHIDVEESRVVVVFDLPPALGFLQPIIESAVRQQGDKLIEPPRAG
ncbi:hypothetical protein FHS61_002728 [Altererythrobacter atlanticus]|uniref:Uncharacterized protein n=1 Tax=Croceibacterium atlanticum TaxID=1267766 RepID=A0A0F7KYH2_9SPHN|nr:polyhydroxyalkanoic acid system family protein [Croceibacterium atlanticum]AKH43865.1 hypothetical protein WYH_02837 [Croceibacterium atlanticum]MBB5733685.1 hypothetical protein [Croceibacterium atlanticum]